MQRGFVDRQLVGDHRYVVQTEDRGLEKALFAVNVFEGGVLVYQRTIPYRDLLALGLADQEELREAALRSVHTRVLRDLAEGSPFQGPGCGILLSGDDSEPVGKLP